MRLSAFRGALGSVLLCGTLCARTASADPTTIDLGGEALELKSLDLPGLEKGEKGDDQLKAWWRGTVDGSEVEVVVRVFDKEEYYLSDPEGVVSYSADVLRMPDYKGDPAFAYASQETIHGKFGWLPYACLAMGPIPNAKSAAGEAMVLGGILEKHAYTVRVYATPRLPDAARQQALDFLRKGVSATGAAEDPKWSAAEAKARWEKDVADPRVRAALKAPVRTKHYLILTDSSAGALFAKRMEACYDAIQKTYPFPEVEGRRLMPLYLFKDNGEYDAFAHRASGMSAVEAWATKGHAWKDYYATSYDSPFDPVHIHEATHQIFRNRLHLTGGGSWFQEGVAEYICTAPGERKAFARTAAHTGKYIPFPQFVGIPSLIRGCAPLDARGAYTQAASMIEFLRDGKWQPEKFLRFVHEVGSVGREDVAGVEDRVQDVYGTGLAGLEKEWVKYWLDR